MHIGYGMNPKYISFNIQNMNFKLLGSARSCSYFAPVTDFNNSHTQRNKTLMKTETNYNYLNADISFLLYLTLPYFDKMYINYIRP